MWNPFHEDGVENFPSCDGLFVMGECSSPMRFVPLGSAEAEERLSVGMLSAMHSVEFPILPAQRRELVLEEERDDEFWQGPLAHLRSPGCDESPMPLNELHEDDEDDWSCETDDEGDALHIELPFSSIKKAPVEKPRLRKKSATRQLFCDPETPEVMKTIEL